MNLIDRSKLEVFGTTCKSQDYIDGVKDTLEYIDNLPTVDAIPVQWIKQFIFLHPDSTAQMVELVDEWRRKQDSECIF